MLKVRVVPTLLIRDVNIVKGPAFDSWRAVGAPLQLVNVFNKRDVDELVLLDIGTALRGGEPDYERLEALVQSCFVPLTIGGGISSLESISRLLRLGADKVSVNSRAYGSSTFVQSASERFGAQCIVIAIDYRYDSNGAAQCYSHCGRTPTGWHPVDWAREVERRGAGEIQLTCIERDGLMCGYDLEMLAAVTAAVSIPVVASGGASCFEDMLKAVRVGGASAVSAASLYLFTQATPLEAKEYLARQGVPVRKPYQAGS